MSRLLRREVNDLDNVRAAMGYLSDIREKEGLIDQEFGPVEEMYSMLQRYEVRLSKEELDRWASCRTRGRSSRPSPTPSPTRSRTCR